MGDSAHTTHHTNPGKKSAPPLFLEDENFFQKSATLVRCGIEFDRVEKSVSFVWGLYGYSAVQDGSTLQERIALRLFCVHFFST
jgi:hypothetical protein